MQENYFRVEALEDGYTALFVGPHNYALDQALAHGFTFDSVERIAQKRVEKGPFHEISWTGSRTTASVVFAHNQYYLTVDPQYSPLYDSFSQEHHELNEECRYEGPDPQNHSDFVPLGNESFDVSLENFFEDRVPELLFGEELGSYYGWLSGIGIPALPIHLPPISLAHYHPYNFVRPLALRCTDNWSGLIAVNDLHIPYGVRATARELTQRTPVVREEAYSVEELAPFAEFLNLEHKGYTFSKLQKHALDNDKQAIFGVILRALRNKGQLIPASYETFADQ